MKGFYPCTQIEYDNIKIPNPEIAYIVFDSDEELYLYLDENGYKSNCLR